MKIRRNMKELSKTVTSRSIYNETKKTESKHCILIGENDEEN